MRHDVESRFNMFIVANFKNQDVIKFLWEHERKDKCLKELCKQIKICEKKDYSIKFDVKKYALVIAETAKMFCRAALKKAEQDNISQAERQRRINESNRMQDIEDEFEADQAEALSKKIISYPIIQSL